MGLRITSLKLVDFRNYESFSLDDIGELTIFVGRNGVGKTNILESIDLLTSADSFRHAQIAQIIRQGCQSARMEMELSDGNRKLTNALSLETGKKRYTVNGKAKSVSDVKGMLPAVSFIPDDLEMAKKSSSVKRGALDELGAQLSKSYYMVHRDYEKALRYKNRLLKDESPQDLIDAINETLLTCATQLYCYRHSLYRRIVPLVESHYRAIAHSDEQFGASYLPSWDYLNNGGREMGIVGFDGGIPDREVVREHLENALVRYNADERVRHRSIVGPHNDKIAFYLGDKDASVFASQGQQRSIVLAWKLAEVELVRVKTGANPALLLDDVMSELDEQRRNMLVKAVGEDAQTFITATDLSSFNESLLSRGRVVELR